jgi:hypothetical protein
MPYLALRALVAGALLPATALAQSPLTIGNLFVVRVGTGLTPLTGSSAATFVDEYTLGGVLVQSIAMPTALSGPNKPLTSSGSSEGFLNVSTNGLYLMLMGYGTPPGFTSVMTSPSLGVPRVIGRIDLAGVVDTSTALTVGYDGGSPRAVVSDDGQRFWTSGYSLLTGGVRFVPYVGATTSLALHHYSLASAWAVGLYNDQLYATCGSFPFLGPCTVGTGLPTTGSQVVTPLPGIVVVGPPTSFPDSNDFFFANPNTLWVADMRANGNGGLQKWTQAGGVWTLQYTLSLSPTSGCRGVTGVVQNGVTTLWATAHVGTATPIVTATDMGPGSPLTTVVAAAPNTRFLGIRYLDAPTTLQRIPASCGAAGVVATGNGEVGTDVITTVLNPAGFGFVGYGASQLMLLFCTCTIVHDFSLLVPGPSHTLSLPYNPTLVGIQLWIQGLDFLAPGGCPDPLFTLTDGYSFTVQ